MALLFTSLLRYVFPSLLGNSVTDRRDVTLQSVKISEHSLGVFPARVAPQRGYPKSGIRHHHYSLYRANRFAVFSSCSSHSEGKMVVGSALKSMGATLCIHCLSVNIGRS